jgi:hypothetical protein
MWRRLTRQIGARYSISLGLIVLIALVVVVARLLPSHGRVPLVTTDPPLPSGQPIATGSAAIDPGESPLPGGSAPVPLHSPVPPVTSPGKKTPTQVATAFAKAWVHHDVTGEVWVKAMTPYATDALAARLATGDPANVPAAEVTGAGTVVDDLADSCVVRVPADTGTLVLGLRANHGSWLVDTVDWDRA